MQRNQAPMGRTDCATPIEKVVQLAEQLGVTSTPTLFFTDGGRAAGALPADQLEERLARASTAAR